MAPALHRHALPRPVAVADRSRVDAPVELEDAVSRFHAEHEREYNYRRDGAPVEIYRLSVRAVGVTPKPELKRHEPTTEQRRSRAASRRRALRGSPATPSRRPCYLRAELPAGATLDGPGDRRPAGLDDRRPAGLARRGRRVAQHPHASEGGVR